MATAVKINLNPTQKILLKRNLEKGGGAQRFLTHEIRRLSDPYVPFRSGPLKNTAIEKVDRIEYVTPYARRQWHENRGNGLRGKQWCMRMWADRGSEIVNSVSAFVGGSSG